MIRYAFTTICTSLIFVTTSFAADIKDATEKVQLVSDRIAKASSGKTNDYSAKYIVSAQASLAAAKAAISASNATLALQKAELADIQMSIADAKASEGAVSEQLALRRAEFGKLDAQFDQYFQAGGK